MKYFKIICSNGFCVCDEEFFEEAETQEEAEEIAQEILQNYYSFCEPDDRFLDVDEDNEEEYADALDEYYENLCYDIEEITEEEYKEEYISH